VVVCPPAPRTCRSSISGPITRRGDLLNTSWNKAGHAGGLRRPSPSRPAYRQMSLLRAARPGVRPTPAMFFLNATPPALGKRRQLSGCPWARASMTCPADHTETQAGDVSAYIPTKRDFDHRWSDFLNLCLSIQAYGQPSCGHLGESPPGSARCPDIRRSRRSLAHSKLDWLSLMNVGGLLPVRLRSRTATTQKQSVAG